jgi:hypothetical protein
MGQNAILREGPTINTMVVFGDVGYTDPAAMWLDDRRRCWLHPEYPVSQTRGEATTMRIMPMADGFHVWPPPDAEYQPTELVSPVHTGIAVVAVHRDRD